jgi:uncharacterized damage-inducible protein DinB
MTEKNRQGIFSTALRSIDGAISSVMQATTSLPGNLVSEIDRFRMVREKTLGMLEEVSAQQALWCPRPGAWSVAQIADHLLLSEQLYREQFRTLIRMAKAGRSSTVEIGLREIDVSFGGIPRDVMRFFETPARMFNRFVPHVMREAMIRNPIVSALNPTVAEPRPGLKILKLREDLTASLDETERVLKGPLPPNVDAQFINHPLLGSNNLTRLLRIMIAHEERHHGQIDGVRGEARFPKAGVR